MRWVPLKMPRIRCEGPRQLPSGVYRTAEQARLPYALMLAGVTP